MFFVIKYANYFILPFSFTNTDYINVIQWLPTRLHIRKKIFVGNIVNSLGKSSKLCVIFSYDFPTLRIVLVFFYIVHSYLGMLFVPPSNLPLRWPNTEGPCVLTLNFH